MIPRLLFHTGTGSRRIALSDFSSEIVVSGTLPLLNLASDGIWRLTDPREKTSTGKLNRNGTARASDGSP
jgi:hypothetical protein